MDIRSFSMPTEIHLGDGALELLPSLCGKRVLVVADPVMTQLGFTERVCGLARQAGAATTVFDAVEPDPSQETCIAGVELAEEFAPDTIVGLGGGSTLDVTKTVRAACETPGVSVPELVAAGFNPPPRQTGRMTCIAIPSTSGTGSEVSRGAVISENTAQGPIKRVLFTGVPDAAILDPAVPATMPAHVAADTGYDALAHAVESFASIESHRVTQALGAGAIATVFAHLPASVQETANTAARAEMHLAAAIAGATMRAGLGLCHALSHQLTPAFGLPHGRANALLLPHVVTFNARAAAEKYTDLATRLGLSGDNPIASLVDALAALRAQVGIPASLQEAGVTKEQLSQKLPHMVANSAKEPNAASNPRQPTPEEIETLYWNAWEDRREEV
ncbi:MAG: iron-containing alcohol dehydrogenase [Chloroflexota bacterium]|nr:iron-containing alcohol dehydrogenase [Chloroflexota bacterium]